jgi:hypothetical protein
VWLGATGRLGRLPGPRRTASDMRTAPLPGRLARPALLALALALLATLVAPQPVAPVATATEPPYRARAFELRDVPYEQLSFTGGPTPHLPPRARVDAHGVPLFRWRDGSLTYRPGEIAINGMLRVDVYLDTGDEAQLAQALVHAAKLRSLALDRRNAWWLPFRFAYPEELQRPPWFNAMAQGLVLSFFSRLYAVTGDETHREAAVRVFRSFLRLGRSRNPWVAYVDGDRSLWLEHYPSRRADHVLNAHLHATFGLYEYWRMTGSPAARRVLEGAITTMRDHASLYRRRGRLSLYCLYHRTAHTKYHGIHVWQLRLLGRIAGDPWFGRLAERLARDVSPPRWVPGTPAHP